MIAPTSPSTPSSASPRRLVLLGSTGSIGTQTLSVVRALAGRVHVEALSAGGTNLPLLARQVEEFQPAAVHVMNGGGAEELQRLLGGRWRGRLLSGAPGLLEVAALPEADLVLVATVGWTGLEPALAAITAGKTIALANKEALVCGGHLITEAARRAGVAILPVDSEHNAIHQCLRGADPAAVRRMILTCSGGPFRNSTAGEIARATAEETLRHPTWEMGRKITVDSATLMNKGFEVIEAHHLFDIPYEKIEVVIHPQSVLHSMVEFEDRSVLAQLGPTDMRLPIQYVLTYPERLAAEADPVDFARLGSLTFDAPDLERFPCLQMAYDAGRAGGSAPCVLNAANEVAVELHLRGEIPCGAIPRLLRRVMEQHEPESHPPLENLREWDQRTRKQAAALAGELARG